MYCFSLLGTISAEWRRFGTLTSNTLDPNTSMKVFPCSIIEESKSTRKSSVSCCSLTVICSMKELVSVLIIAFIELVAIELAYSLVLWRRSSTFGLIPNLFTMKSALFVDRQVLATRCVNFFLCTLRLLLCTSPVVMSLIIGSLYVKLSPTLTVRLVQYCVKVVLRKCFRFSVCLSCIIFEYDVWGLYWNF